MAHRILPPAAELAAIHAAVCRYRAQQLACSTCCDLAERAARCVVQLREAA